MGCFYHITETVLCRSDKASCHLLNRRTRRQLQTKRHNGENNTVTVSHLANKVPFCWSKQQLRALAWYRRQRSRFPACHPIEMNPTQYNSTPPTNPSNAVDQLILPLCSFYLFIRYFDVAENQLPETGG